MPIPDGPTVPRIGRARRKEPVRCPSPVHVQVAIRTRLRSTVKREQQCQVVTSSEGSDVRVPVDLQDVAPTVEDHPDAAVALCRSVSVSANPTQKQTSDSAFTARGLRPARK